MEEKDRELFAMKKDNEVVCVVFPFLFPLNPF